MRRSLSRLLKVTCFFQSLFSIQSIFAFWGKTELELNGIGVIKESAQILSRSIDTFPARSTAIAFLGLIIFSQGIYLFGKGFVNLVSNSGDDQIRRRGQAQFVLGLLLTIVGTLAALFCTKIVILCFA